MSSEKPSIPNSLNEHWMPFTSNKLFKEHPRLIVEAKGVYLKNHQGKGIGSRHIESLMGFLPKTYKFSLTLDLDAPNIKNIPIKETVPYKCYNKHGFEIDEYNPKVSSLGANLIEHFQNTGQRFVSMQRKARR